MQGDLFMESVIMGFYVDIPGHRLYMDVAGDPAGQPVVLLHTAGQQGLQWRFVLPRLAEQGYYAIAPDLPGHGKSLLKNFTPLQTVASFSDVIMELVRVLNLKQPLLIGCSLGGDIVLDIAVKWSSHLLAVIACEAAGRTATIPEAFVEAGLEDAGMPSYSDQGYLGGHSACGLKGSPERLAEIAWTRRTGDPKIYHSDLKAWIHHDITEKLHEISCPVLMVWGSEDYFLPRNLIEETVENIPNAQLKVLEGIGHYPHMEMDDFTMVIREFLESL